MENGSPICGYMRCHLLHHDPRNQHVLQRPQRGIGDQEKDLRGNLRREAKLQYGRERKRKGCC